MRTVKEVLNLMKKLRDMGAISVKVGEVVEATFIPEQILETKPLPVLNSNTSVIPPLKELKGLDEVNPFLEADDPDLYDAVK